MKEKKICIFCFTCVASLITQAYIKFLTPKNNGLSLIWNSAEIAHLTLSQPIKKIIELGATTKNKTYQPTNKDWWTTCGEVCVSLFLHFIKPSSCADAVITSFVFEKDDELERKKMSFISSPSLSLFFGGAYHPQEKIIDNGMRTKEILVWQIKNILGENKPTFFITRQVFCFQLMERINNFPRKNKSH